MAPSSERSEPRQALLLGLSDALRPLADPVEIRNTACTLLAGHLHADRAVHFDIEGGEAAGGTLADLAHVLLRTATDDDMLVADDVAGDPRLSDAERAHAASAGIGAFVVAVLLRDGRVAALGVQSAEPRRWLPDEVALVRDVAERVQDATERGRTEAAVGLGESGHPIRGRHLPGGQLRHALDGADLCRLFSRQRRILGRRRPARDPRASPHQAGPRRRGLLREQPRPPALVGRRRVARRRRRRANVDAVARAPSGRTGRSSTAPRRASGWPTGRAASWT